MKKLVLLTLVVASLWACNNDFESDDVYSCNEQLNEWAHTNLRSIQTMNWESWQDLDEEYKKPAFAAMTPSQKILFWKDKIRAVLQLNWTDQERQHITKLYNFFENNPNMYVPEILNDPEETQKRKEFFDQWEVDVLYDLRWTEKQVYAVIYIGNRLLNTDGGYQTRQNIRLRSSSESGGSSGDCDCIKGKSGCTGSCSKPTYICGGGMSLECDGKSI